MPYIIPHFSIFTNGPSWVIKEESVIGNIQGIRMQKGICLTHILFVDRFLLFGFGSIGGEHWKEL
jgi:hypothetical protein